MEIFFVRHTSVAVPAGYAYGQTDVPLSDSFEEEAANVKREIENLDFDEVWSSPFTRCLRLSDYCGFPTPKKDDRLKEINFGEWEMKSWTELSSDPRLELWFKDWIHIQTPKGESFLDQYNRVSDFLDDIRKSDKARVCVFAHGGVLTCARVYAGEYSLEEAFKHVPSYGAVVKIVLE